MKKTFLLLLVLCSIACVAQRLPADVAPIHYTLAFTPDLAAATFAGRETLQVRVVQPTDTITLNAADIDFKKVTVRSANGEQTASVSLDPDHQTASLHVPNRLAAGNAVLKIEFDGILNDKLRGFYLSRSKQRNYATTQFESTDARRAFPSFDEPALKATFDISLTIDQGDTAISNGKIVSDAPGPGPGKHTLKFATTPKMSTYLVAMAVGDWQCVEGAADGIPIRVCATPDKKQLGSFALIAAEHILGYFDRYYGIKYPYGKLDILAVPDFEAGAMENTAAIIYREIFLLIDEKNSSVAAQKNVAGILAHEMAHLWFGDLVTMKWWDDIWLNEGFATWMPSKPVGAWKPEWNVSLEDVQATSGTLTVDATSTTRQIRQSASTPEEINELFDGIAYGKAAAVLHMVEDYVGAETFRKGVNLYLREHAYGNATAEDFWNAVARASGKPVAKIMSSFIDQPGEPLISVRTRCSGNTTVAEVAQQRFYSNSREFGSSPNQHWAIPVCFRVGKGAAQDCRILDQPQQEFQFAQCSSDVTANASGSGYYRTAYAPDVLEKLPGADWTPAERVRLVGDTWALVRAGQQTAGDYLSLLGRMGADPERVVLETQIAPLTIIGSYLVDASEKDRFAGFLRQFLGPTVKRLGWKPAAGEGAQIRELRPELIGLLGRFANDPDLLQQAQQVATQYLNDRSSLDPSMVPTALALAGKTGGTALYDRYVDAMKSAKSPEEYLNFFFTLSSFAEPALVQRTIEMTMSPEVRSQDAPNLISVMIRNPETRQLTWELTKQHWAEVDKKLTISSGGRIVAAAGAFCDSASRDDVSQFFNTHTVASSERTLKQTLNQIDSCIDLRTQQGDKLAKWLDGSQDSGSGSAIHAGAPSN